nr:class I poly(R)-hydroxyalkanoic acid synthase [Pararhodospirillum photometricum]
MWAASLQVPLAQPEIQVPDRDAMAESFQDLARRVMDNPTPFLDAQATLWRDYVTLCERSAARLRGSEALPVVTPEASDRRFKDEVWRDDPLFDHLKQSYLMTARAVLAAVRKVEGVDERSRQRMEFYTRLVLDALAPTNYLATNPEARRAFLESNGRSLVQGMENLLRDLERGGGGSVRVAMTDEAAFEVGRTLAVTPGKVVYQNDLIQLIQYSPTTETVAQRPLLVVPPWINKFYIMDLTPKNSFIRYMVEQGLTVFVVSWVNPGPELGHKDFGDYMNEGPLAAMEAIASLTGERDLTLMGYCIGGTLCAATLAYLAARGDERVKAVTFLTTMVDFSEPGELGVFIEPHLLDKLDAVMERNGTLDGRYMANAFNLLRDNELIWSFHINNYLLGKDPPAFDLLYWNADSTRMPAMMHTYYLRRMYERNELVQPGALTLLGTPIDLRRIRTPAYLLSTREDHIAPWKSTFKATALYSGPVRFVLAGSGHIAGVINPPGRPKYGHWTNTRKVRDPDTWLAGAKENEGSWWPDWRAWLAKHAGSAVPARDPGAGLEDAPGSYVKKRL